MDATFLQLITDLQPKNGTEFCQTYLEGSANAAAKLTKEASSPYKVWGIGMLMVSLIFLSSASGILLIPFLSPAIYERVLTFLVAVAVGTLSGSALFSLLPEAFDLAVYGSDFLHKAWMILAGIYLFYIVDKFLNVSIALQQKRIVSPQSELEMSSSPKIVDESQLKHKHHHGSVDSEHPHVATIAWLVIFGDCLHNFIDGISIGAAFEEDIWNGISIAVAVLCEEVPHELGDCAILISSGMSPWRALFCNLLSSLPCFVGFVIGVLVGNTSTYFGQYIFALAAGMFLYISLVGMLSEMNRKVKEEVQQNTTQAIKTITLQMCGLIIGLTLMYIFARYGYLIQFQ